MCVGGVMESNNELSKRIVRFWVQREWTKFRRWAIFVIFRQNNGRFRIALYRIIKIHSFGLFCVIAIQNYSEIVK